MGGLLLDGGNITGYDQLIIDVVICVLLFVFALFGLGKGGIKSIISTVGFFVSIIVGALVASFVVKFCQDSFGLVTWVTNLISGPVNTLFGGALDGIDISVCTHENLSQAGIAEWLIVKILAFKDAGETGLVINYVCQVFGNFISLFLAGMVIAFLVRIIFWVIEGIYTRKTINNGVSKINRIIGLIVGLVKGVVFVQTFMLILNLLPFDFCKNIVIMTKASPFANFLSNYNLINIIWNALFKIIQI